MRSQTLFRILLVILVLVFAVLAFRSIMRPEKFKMVYTERHNEIRNRLITIRAAQQVYKMEHKDFAKDIDELYDFVQNGTVTIVKISGSIPEGMSEAEAFQKGLITKTEIKYPASKRVLEMDANVREANLKNFHRIPGTDGKKFEIQTSTIKGATYEIGVYRIDVPLDDILANMERAISPEGANVFTRFYNYIMYTGLEDETQYRKLYNPMFMGSLTEASTSGSWEI
ncbi:MAG: hypothetical protein PHR19_02050 [Bacteroidales bacterium]|jgi:hypothetical protein|nr:hypothetical protein [Bacteroidales bacterium]HHT51594.1 hypothetical protein [Bacteroidales bacterium]